MRRRTPLKGGALALPHTLALPEDLLALRPRAIWRAMMRQRLSFWALFIYLFFEYVRPQAIYPALDLLPFALLSLVAAATAAIVEMNGKRKWQLLDTGMLFFSLVVAASLLTAFDRAYGMEFIGGYISWVVIYLVMAATVNTQTRMFLLLASWLLWNLKMSMFAFRSWAAIGFGFRDWGVVGAPGWFENSGEFGIQMCVVMPIGLYFALGLRKHVPKAVFIGLLVLPFTAISGAIASSSRGALLGMLAVGLWILLRSKYRVRGAIALTVLVVGAYATVPAEQKERLLSSGDDATSVSRFTYWERGRAIAREHPLLGVGYKNWTPYNAYLLGTSGSATRVGLPHNIFIECMAELGYTGLLALIVLMVGTIRLNAKTRKLAKSLGAQGDFSRHLTYGFDAALIGYIVSGFFVTVLYYPYLWINLGYTAGLYASVARAVKGAHPVAPAQRASPALGITPVGTPVAR